MGEEQRMDMSNIIGIGDKLENNKFSIIKQNNFLMLCYNGDIIPFQTGMLLTNDINHDKCISVEVTINCLVGIDDFIKP